MPLQVWLPLTGDLTNNGLNDLEPIQTTAPTYVDGKLGKAMSTGALYLPAKDVAKFYNNNAMSFAFWIYPVGTSGSGPIIGKEGMSAGDNRMFTIFQYPSPNDLHLSWQSNESGTTFLGSILYGAFPSDTWTHCAIAYDGAKAAIYINGEYQTAWNGVSTRTNFEYDVPIPSKSIRYLNDFRIYDHCLSPKEVKVLSQGLVAHYQLNDGYLEPTTNMTNVRYVGADSGSGWGGHTSVTTVINCQDAPIPYDACSKIAVTYSGSGGGGVGRFIQRIDVSPNTTYTYSAYIKASNNFGGQSLPNMLYRYEYNSSGTNIYETGVFDVSRRISLGDGWYRCWGTFTTKDTTASISIYFFVYPYADVDYYVGCWQLEQKDHLTPYVFGTRSETTVYDSSGFNNHMIAVGNPTISSDSIRNSVSTYFVNGQYALAQQNANLYLPKDSITVSLWIKCSTWGNPISCTEGGGWNFEDIGSGLQFPAYISGVGYKIANSGLSPSTLLNAWHMLTGTFDGTTLKIYVDAQLKGTTSTGTTNPIGYAANRLVISGEAQGATPASSTYVGNISDVRIYATALSAEDIKALYQTSASIDNAGTMYAYEFNEV